MRAARSKKMQALMDDPGFADKLRRALWEMGEQPHDFVIEHNGKRVRFSMRPPKTSHC
jgi:hypothetical protein